MIKLKNVNKYYKSGNDLIHVLKDLNYEFPDTGLVFILGPSGSGKSTLLNLLGGLDSVDSGEIWIEDGETKLNLNRLSPTEKNNYLNSYLGFVFQEYNILKDLNLRQNISLSLEIQGYKKRKAKKLINQIISDVELKGLEKRKVSQLSGGQKQRIAIARALVKNPKLIIADEPTGNLDSETSTKIFDLFKKLSKDRLIIIVSHDEESANLYADDILRIKTASKEQSIEKIEIPVQQPVEKYKKLKLEKAKTPLLTITKLAFKNIWQRKFRYFLILIICAISLTFLSFAIELNGDKLYQNVYTSVNNKVHYTDIYQYHPSQNENKKDFYSKYQMGALQPNAYDTIKYFAKDLTIHKYQPVSIGYTTKYQLEKANFLYSGKISTVIQYDETNNYKLFAGRLPNPEEPEILISDFIFDSFKHFGIIDKNAQVYDILNRWYDFDLETDLKIVGVVESEYANWLKLTNQSIYDKNYEYSAHDNTFNGFKNDYLMMNAIIIGSKYFDSVCCEGVTINIANTDDSNNFDLEDGFIKAISKEKIFGKSELNDDEIIIPLLDAIKLGWITDLEATILQDETVQEETKQLILNKIINNSINLEIGYNDIKLSKDKYLVKTTKVFKVVGTSPSSNYLLSKTAYDKHIEGINLIKSQQITTTKQYQNTNNLLNEEFLIKMNGVVLNERGLNANPSKILFGTLPKATDEITVPWSSLLDGTFSSLSFDWREEIFIYNHEHEAFDPLYGEYWEVQRHKSILSKLNNIPVRISNCLEKINVANESYNIIVNKGYKIVGVTEDNNFHLSSNGVADFLTSFENIQSLKQTEKIVVELEKDPQKALKQFKQLYNNDYHFVINVFQFKDEIESYNVDPMIEFASTGGLIVFSILTIGIMWTVISIEIVDSKKEIGIMRSIGLSGFKVSLIFFVQMVFINALAYGISIPCAKTAIELYGKDIMDPLGVVKLSLYTMTYRTPIYLAIFVALITLISTFIPLFKIMSKKIINVINERDE